MILSNNPKIEIFNADCLEKMKDLPDNSIDAIVSDPPYELGFMGKAWDASGIAYNVDLWKECLRVLKPGGHLLAFGGTRTYHRMAVAIEDAGFEVRDMLEWIYASGFPKSLNIGKKYDQLQGNEREVVGEKRTPDGKLWSERRPKGDITGYKGNGEEIKTSAQNIDTKGNSEWEGFGTALKPAHEPIILARRPLECKTIVENVLKHGTGVIDIDGCRIPTQTGEDFGKAVDDYGDKAGGQWQQGKQIRSVPPEQGRFPANIICTDDALNDGVMTKSGSGNNTIGLQKAGKINNWTKQTDKDTPMIYDSGSKSRYFDIDVWAEKHGLLQFPKSSKRERNAGMEGYVLKSGVSDEIVKEIKNLLSI